MDRLQRYGDLTDGQIAAVQKSIEQNKIQAEQHEEAVRSAPVIEIAAIEHAFDSARANGLSRLSLRLGDYVFKPASMDSKNSGSIYVTKHENYLGKITSGKFIASRECTNEQKQEILETASDPRSAAIAHGKKTGNCSCCGRTLTNKASIDLGIGPVCAEKYGW